ncbi:MAG: hypothetical protein LBE35_09090 [Clostridiales bacterium]|jgi:peptidoglycan glycosyltransferase|nr:hypothetical protein [Clostridiales bacterium]
MRRNIGQMFWVLAVIFMAMGAYFVWTAAVDGRNFAAHPFNGRVNIEGRGLRGTIYDARGRVLAYDSEFGRNYPFGAVFAHVVGYSGMSRAGLELSQNFTLTRLSRELIQMTAAVIFNDEVAGNSIETTLDADIQSIIHNGLDGARGAAVVLNAQTGAIVAMASAPGFEPELVEQDWGRLLGDGASPLLNRATQGLYPPGSTFKLITALAALEYDMELLDFVFDCTGQISFEGQTLQCFGGTAHGEVDFNRAMALSCNGYFAVLAQKIDAGHIIAAAERAALFNREIPFELAASMPLFSMPNEPELSELVETAIGQGRTLATPLNMALLAAAIANDGIMPEPFMVERVVGAFDNTVGRHSPRRIGRVMPAEIAEILADSMVDAVNFGTAAPATLNHVQVAGKTGTAQNETGIDHSWFIGFAGDYALAIIIENTGGGTRATRLAGEILLRLTE